MRYGRPARRRDAIADLTDAATEGATISDMQVAPYGSWRSPITSDAIVAATVTLGQIVLDGHDVYWTEQRPMEGGRTAIVRCRPSGAIADAIPPDANARTRVHEYGGGAYTVEDGAVYFTSYADQRLYRILPGQAPEPLTPDAPGGALRYADLVVDRARQRILCVREDHTAGGEPVNTLVAVPLDGDPERGSGTALASGSDFYAAPALSPDGARLAWLSWNHPNMPWDGTELWVADVQAGGSLGQAQRVAGGVDEAVFQPEWSPDGRLCFVSDRTGWGNLYRWDPRTQQTEALLPQEAEFGAPLWQLASTSYAFDSAARLVCRALHRGEVRHLLLDLNSLEARQLATPYTSFTRGQTLRATDGQAYLIGASPSQTPTVVALDLNSGVTRVLRRSSDMQLDARCVSAAQAIEFPTEGARTAHAFYYPPRNADFTAPEGERPPLIVKSHGGPTSATSSALDANVQYWTSRGFAVLDVNYGGSTGYGREYMLRLRGQWGVVDVDDCVNGARYLAEQGLVDGHRLVITGGSAGGYTTLCALTSRDDFSAGASYYGVSDLEALATDTHKFESRYLDSLVGPYPARRDLYVERSPIHHAARLSCPVIFFQGLEDPVVPPNQAERMVAALRVKGVPVAYVPFAGERHGFRQAANIKRALDSELYFYSRVFRFPLAEPVAPVEIDNLG